MHILSHTHVLINRLVFLHCVPMDAVLIWTLLVLCLQGLRPPCHTPLFLGTVSWILHPNWVCLLWTGCKCECHHIPFLAVFHLDGVWLSTTFRSLYASCCSWRRAVENSSSLNTGTDAICIATAPECIAVIQIAIDPLNECFGTARIVHVHMGVSLMYHA